MPRSPFLSLDPNLDLPKAFEQILTEEQGQKKGVLDVQAGQNKNLESAYGQLTGDLQKGAGTIKSIYGDAAGNVQAAYNRAGTGAQAAAGETQTNIGEFASRLGMDPRALAEVQGGLAKQAQTFELRNRQSSADRVGNLNQLGASMSAVAQLGVQAAQQALAQGKTDLAKRIQNELQRVATSAASARTGFTAAKAQQAAQATASAQKAILSAEKEMRSASRSASRSSGGGGGRSSKGSSGPDWMTKFQLQNEENDRRFLRGRGEPQADPYQEALATYTSSGYGPRARSYIDARLAGATQKDAAKQFGKGLNRNAMESTYNRLKIAEKATRK